MWWLSSLTQFREPKVIAVMGTAVAASSSRPFSLILLSSQPPRAVARLASRINHEVPGARVGGILYQLGARKTFWKRAIAFLYNLREWTFIRYSIARFLCWVPILLLRISEALMRLITACPDRPNGPTDFGLKGLADFSQGIDCSLLVTTDPRSPEVTGFVRRLQPDLGIVYGTCILQAKLFDVPRLGWINLHKRRLPDYRGEGPVGLWELLDGREEIGITVHRAEPESNSGAIIRAAELPIEPFDTLKSLELKAALVGDDLLVRSVVDFARGEVLERPQVGAGRTYEAPSQHHLWLYERQIASHRPRYQLQRGRPVWKLLLRTFMLGPYVMIHNWFRRLRGTFPVIVLYHHLVTDRPHHLGIPTELLLKQMQFLRTHYKIVSLGEAIRMLQTNTANVPTVVLTFDDGYECNFVNLRAVTEDVGVAVTLFVSTEHVSTRKEFEHDRERGQRNFLPLTWEQIEYLSRNGFEIGSHTRSHFDCGSIDRAALEREIRGSKTDLESRLGRPIRFFSFPIGKRANMSEPAVELAKSTYSYIFSTYGRANFAPRGGSFFHVSRCPHPNDIWELELALQSVLEFREVLV